MNENFRVALLFLSVVSDTDMKTVEKYFQRYSPMIFSIAVKILKSSEDAEDLVHDFFVGRMQKILTRQPPLSETEIARMIAVSAKNFAIDIYRRNKRSQQLNDEHFGGAEAPDPSLALCLEKLEPRYQEVLKLKYLMNYRWEEVAEKTGLSPQGARKRAAKGLNTLRNWFQKEGEQ
jgi:RNA polymerase sigma-70 factor (ECF subfamily)